MDNIIIASIDDVIDICHINSGLNVSGSPDFKYIRRDCIADAVDKGLCFVEKNNKKVVSAMVLEDGFMDSDGKIQYNVGSLIVDEKFRSRGIGIRMMELAKLLAFEENKDLCINTPLQLNNLGFYEHLGFQSLGIGSSKENPYRALRFNTRPIPFFPEMKRIDIGDRLQYIDLLDQLPVVPSDLTFYNMFAFDCEGEKYYLSMLNDNLIVVTEKEGNDFLHPIIGTNRIKDTIREVVSWYNDNGIKLGLVLTKDQAAKLCEGCEAHIEPMRDEFEYIYDTKNLVNMINADDMHRKNLKRYLNMFHPSYMPLTNAIRDQVLDFNENWISQKFGDAPPMNVTTESRAIKKALNNLNTLDLTGGCIYSNDHLAGFTLGEKFNGTGYLFIEKAEKERGSYQALIHLFGINELLDCVTTINKEQDLGDLGLRQNKMSYGPKGFVEKYSVSDFVY